MWQCNGGTHFMRDATDCQLPSGASVSTGEQRLCGLLVQRNSMGESVRTAILVFLFCACSVAQPSKPSPWWVHGPVLAHLGAAGLDALSSWKQPEANGMYRQQSGPFAGRFYTTGAARMAGFTIGLTSASEILSALKPRWRRAIGVLNLGAAGAHGGASAYNLSKNPNSR